MEQTHTDTARDQTEQSLRVFGVAAVIRFGSQVTGHVGPLSDTDLAVLLQEPIDRHRTAALAAELEPLLANLSPAAKQIEVTILNTAPVGLQLEVLRHGQSLTVLDSITLAEFRESVMQRAGDLRPFLRSFRTERLRRLYA